MDLSKRQTLRALAGLGVLASVPRTWAQSRAIDLRDIPVSSTYDLHVAETLLNVTGKPAHGITINGTMPGPVLRLRQGDEVEIRVTNHLRENTAIHWHGLLVPNDQDGVPGVTFPGIPAGETFTYRFKLRQSGTYWYHSHAALQEAAGYFAPLIIEPVQPDPFQFDRDYVVVISDWNDTPPAQVLANLKKVDGYYNYRRVTTPQFLAQLRSAPDANARSALWAERMEWASMRMDPTDFSDGSDEWSFLLQGKRSDENWTALFNPGERVRLRFINASPMNLYDVRIPGLPMTVVQADGQNVEPTEVDELRIGNGETYDVIVQPTQLKAYTIFVPTIARIGHARGTLAPQLGMQGPVPEMGPMPVRTMADMGMAGMTGMLMGEGRATMDMGRASAGAAHAGMAMPAVSQGGADRLGGLLEMPGMQTDPHAGMVMAAPAPPPDARVRMPEMGESTRTPQPEADGLRRLRYAQLRSLIRNVDDRKPTKELLVRLTGDMTRYFWGINGKKLSQAEPFELGLGERVRIKFVNETMMEHPMHLHGVFMELVNGNGPFAPRKHTVIVPPAQTLELDFTFDDPGTWALHCHLFYHAATGMMRLVKVA